MWAESDATEMGGVCHRRKNLQEATTICEEAGARLCTAAELQADCTASSGCSFDGQLVWSSTAEEDACTNSRCRRRLRGQTRISRLRQLVLEAYSDFPSDVVLGEFPSIGAIALRVDESGALFDAILDSLLVARVSANCLISLPVEETQRHRSATNDNWGLDRIDQRVGTL